MRTLERQRRVTQGKTGDIVQDKSRNCRSAADAPYEYAEEEKSGKPRREHRYEFLEFVEERTCLGMRKHKCRGYSKDSGGKREYLAPTHLRFG